MIEFIKGNIWETDAEAIVIPVNCVGVAGAGLAKQAKQKYPQWFKDYENTCRYYDMTPGDISSLVNNWSSEKGKYNDYFINAFTKDHWRQNSNCSSVAACIYNIKKHLSKNSVESIAVPALGCGCGNLKWEIVRNFMIEQFIDSDVKFIVYEPVD